MNKTNENLFRLGPLLFALAAMTGISLGACNGDEQETDYVAPPEVQNACADYCARAKDCNDETDEPKCVENCADAMGNCQVSELDLAVDQLQQCSNDACDDFVGCSVQAGAQCLFGL